MLYLQFNTAKECRAFAKDIVIYVPHLIWELVNISHHLLGVLLLNSNEKSLWDAQIPSPHQWHEEAGAVLQAPTRYSSPTVNPGIVQRKAFCCTLYLVFLPIKLDPHENGRPPKLLLTFILLYPFIPYLMHRVVLNAKTLKNLVLVL